MCSWRKRLSTRHEDINRIFRVEAILSGHQSAVGLRGREAKSGPTAAVARGQGRYSCTAKGIHNFLRICSYVGRFSHAEALMSGAFPTPNMFGAFPVVFQFSYSSFPLVLFDARWSILAILTKKQMLHNRVQSRVENHISSLKNHAYN